MTIAVLLRLRSDALAQGRVAGQAEVIDTGQCVSFGDLDQMLSFLVACFGDSDPLVELASVDPPDTGAEGRRTIAGL
jgi:hypothetical protein